MSPNDALHGCQPDSGAGELLGAVQTLEGADQLVGKGDMLLSTGSDLLRLQCAFVDTPEVEKVTEFIGSQRAYPDAFALPEYFDEEAAASEDFDPNGRSMC